MEKIGHTLGRRQFIKAAMAIFGGLFSFLLLDFPHKAKAHSKKDVDDVSKYICEIYGSGV